MWNQLQILAPEGMNLAAGKVGERHFEAAAHPGIQVVNLTSESIWWKPLAHGIGIQKCPIYGFCLGSQDAMKPDRVCCHSTLMLS